MTTFVMLTRVASESLRSPRSFAELERKAMNHIRTECPEVKWIFSYAVTGPYDYIDVFEAPDVHAAMKVSSLIRSFGRSSSEIWPAVEWGEFKRILESLGEEESGLSSGAPPPGEGTT